MRTLKHAKVQKNKVRVCLYLARSSDPQPSTSPARAPQLVILINGNKRMTSKGREVVQVALAESEMGRLLGQ